VEGPKRAKLRRPGGQVHRQHAERREGPQQDRPGGLGSAQWRDGQPVQVRADTVATSLFPVNPGTGSFFDQWIRDPVLF
jgi:hypothetical protein